MSTAELDPVNPEAELNTAKQKPIPPERQILQQSNSESSATNDIVTDDAPSKIIESSKRMLVLMFGIFVLGVVMILWAWRLGPFNTDIQQTDNSYIKGQTTLLSSQINGYIQAVYAKDFDQVKAGQVLMRIDATPYEQQVSQARSALEQVKNDLANQNQLIEQRQADILAAQAKVEQSQVEYELSKNQYHRFQLLGNSGATAQSDNDKALAQMKNNAALLKEAHANVTVAEQALKTEQVAQIGLGAMVDRAQAQLDQAHTTENYSTIRAPIEGQLGEVLPRVGQYVSAGSQLLYLIPEQRWIIANFKETQIAQMQVGQTAWFTVDALKHQKFTGRVLHISPATGSEFSVLKADNATGNFTKVVQRISVRIAIDPDQPDLAALRPGMSVVTSVDTSSKP